MSKDVPNIVLALDYLTPSLNVTKRQHWSKQYQEKQQAFRKLACALLDIEYGLLTRTISQEEQKIASTAYATLVCYMATIQPAWSSKHSKSK